MALEFDIPELPAYRPVAGRFLLFRVFGAGGPKAPLIYGLVMNLVRLTDLAVREYSEGRRTILEFASSSEELRIGSAIRSSAHFEVSIDALKRVINFIKAIRSHKDAPQSLKDLFPRNLKLLTGDAESKITDLRDAIQHLEGQVQRGNIAEGQSFALQAMNDRLELGGFCVTYVELAGWLNEAYDLAESVVNYRES
jgi:hypothetical protein